MPATNHSITLKEHELVLEKVLRKTEAKLPSQFIDLLPQLPQFYSQTSADYRFKLLNPKVKRKEVPHFHFWPLHSLFISLPHQRNGVSDWHVARPASLPIYIFPMNGAEVLGSWTKTVVLSMCASSVASNSQVGHPV